MTLRKPAAALGICLFVVEGCGHAEPATTTTTPLAEVHEAPPPPVPTGPSEPEPEPEAEAEPTAPGIFVADLEDVPRLPLPSFTEALDSCRNPDAGACVVRRTAGFDGGHWVVFDVDSGEMSPGNAWLGRVATGTNGTVPAPSFEGPVQRSNVTALRRALRTFRSVTPGENLVRRATSVPYSITAYNALVSLGGQLSGWSMWIESSGDGYQLHMGRDSNLTDSRVAGVSPGDAHCHDGYQADQLEDPPSDVPAGPRPCTPIGIDAVLLSPDRTSILVMGTRAMEGHGGAPAMHWSVPTPWNVIPRIAESEEPRVYVERFDWTDVTYSFSSYVNRDEHTPRPRFGFGIRFEQLPDGAASGAGIDHLSGICSDRELSPGDIITLRCPYEGYVTRLHVAREDTTIVVRREDFQESSPEAQSDGAGAGVVTHRFEFPAGVQLREALPRAPLDAD